jgi:transcriptional regulator with XRE-family HTH domain
VPSSSSVEQARKALGQRLREIRKDAGLTARELAGRAGWHESKCSRMEHGKSRPSDADIRAWALLCGAEEQVPELIASARGIEGMYVEWRRLERGGLRRVQESVNPLFDRTSHFRAYSSWLVPGLLQTPGYTGALLRSVARRRGVPGDIDGALAVRMRRQRVLHEGKRRFAILIEESVLRTTVGDADAMAGQLGHLLNVGALPNVSVGILPSGIDRSPMRPVEDFWIFDQAQVNVELVSAWLTIKQPQEIRMYAETFGALAQLAVYGAAARARITAAIDALE